MENESFIKGLLGSFDLVENNVAFSLYNGERVTDITYRQFSSDILRAAGYFCDRKINGQHVAIAAVNSYDWIVTFFAILASGNVAIPLNQDLPIDILQWECEKAEVVLICCDTSSIITCGNQLSNVNFISFDTLKNDVPITSDIVYSAAPNETIFMLFTSGTTGKSKAVEITSDNWRYSIQNFEEQYTMRGMERVFAPIPLYHIAGLVHVVKTLHFNRTVCLGRGIKYLFMDMPALNPTVLNAVPSIIETLARVLKKASTEQERKKYIGNNLQRLTFGGAALKGSVIRFLLAQGYSITAIYGMTEISAAATWGSIDDAEHINTVGKLCDCLQYCFKDGELLLKGPTLMKGYYNDPDETARIIENGWIHTGDLGYSDEEGYLYLTGRKKNVIILSNGENVNPEEIEEKLGICSQILECLIYADSKGICADVYTENKVAAADFIKKYNEEAPLYRQVYKVTYFTVPLEKTGSGKIKRKENVYV